MDCKFTFKHLEPLDSITQYAQGRIEKIEKYNMHKEMKVHFIFSVQKESQEAEVVVDTGGQHYTAKASDPTLYAAIDLVVDKLEHQLRKHKDKIQNHHNFNASNEGYLKQEIAAQARELHEDDNKVLRMKGKK